MTEKITTTVETARKLAVAKQHLANKPIKSPNSDDIIALFRDIGCIQLDPISAVAPSHLIVLWSRLGSFDRSTLDRLLWQDKKLFEYWAHQYSIVLMEDYPLYHAMMARYPQFFAKGWGPAWSQQVQKWLDKNSQLEKYVLNELKQKGPLLSRQFEDESRVKPRGSGWGSWGNVQRMLFHQLFKGKVMVVGRQGNQKLWGLSENFLPGWVSKKELSMEQVEYDAVQRSIRSLGIASPSEIDVHFLRGRYRNLKQTLKRLVEDSKIYPVSLRNSKVDTSERYVHAKDVLLLDKLGSDDPKQRATLLSPFDNLICDRKRTKSLFGFDYTVEIYTPSHKRKYGYYVLPILYGDKLVGRVDPYMDRKSDVLKIKTVHAEPKAPKGEDVSSEIRNAIDDLSRFLGAKEVVFSKRVPNVWRSALR